MSRSVGCKLELVYRTTTVPNSSATALCTFQLFDKNDHACFMLCDSSSKRKEEEEEEKKKKRDPQRRLILFLEGKRKIVKHPILYRSCLRIVDEMEKL